MNDRRQIVLDLDRHLKWRAFDRLEALLMVLCGIAIAGFSLCVILDILTRSLRSPWLWLQEVTSAFFIYGSFLGMAVATRRADHLMLSAISESMAGRWRFWVEIFNRLVILACGLCMLGFGWRNFLHGFGSYPHAVLDPARLVVPRDPDRRRLHLPVRLRAAGQRLAQRLPGPRARGRGEGAHPVITGGGAPETRR